MNRMLLGLSAGSLVLMLFFLPVYAAPAVENAQETPVQAEKETKNDRSSESSESSGAIPTGTAVLVGAGAYTYVRVKRKEKKSEQKYEYFENHTQNGTLREEEKWHQG